MQLFLFIISLIFSCHTLHGAHIEHAWLMPDFRVQATPVFNECMGGSLLAEAGRRNVRLNGTLGLLYGWDERFKLTGEFLQQKLPFRFENRKEERRVHQYALGASYQQDFCYCYLSRGEIKGYISYAPSKKLSSEVFADRIHSRLINGSTAYGGEVNFEVNPWQCAALTIGLDYDGVSFHRRFAQRKYIAGFGGSVALCQNILDNLALNVKAEFRRPYNYFEANLTWLPFTQLACGIFGSYTEGKAKLPKVATAGIEINYAFSLGSCSECQEYSQIAGWVSTPAVCLPEVLVIAEERICHFPTSVPIPPFVISATGFYALNMALFFTNPDNLPLVFTASGLPSGSTIDPTTGIISGFNPADGLPRVVTVTATKSCASTSQTFTITYL